MTIIYIILILLLFIIILMVPMVRIMFLSPIKTIFYTIKDGLTYIIHREYDYYYGGQLECFFAHFGGGKTLSATRKVRRLYKRYNNRKVWDKKKKRFVIQKVHILSNVHLNDVPYEPLYSLGQFVACAKANKRIDEKQNTHTCLLVLIDEASVQLNSRQFRDNFANADVLNSILTSRHFSASIFITAQKFKLVDALMRSVTQQAIWCHKVWRFMIQYTYSADELEVASDARLIKPIRRTGFFITDRDYNAYDTLATVENLIKSAQEKDMLTDEQIIALRGEMNPDNNNIIHPSKKLRKMRGKRK